LKRCTIKNIGFSILLQLSVLATDEESTQ